MVSSGRPSEFIGGSAVVDQWPGQWTGDTIYLTEDGRIWAPCRNPHEEITGREVRTVQRIDPNK
jgi:hypothetical protein